MTDSYPQKRKGGLTKKAKTGLIVLCFVILAAIAAAVIQIASLSEGGSFITPIPLKHGSRLFTLETLKRPKHFFSSFSFDNYIAVLHVEGVIEDSGETYNQNWILDTIDELGRDRKNSGILLYIDSPGGGVYQSDEVYLALEDYKHSTGNRVWAYMGPLPASMKMSASLTMARRASLPSSVKGFMEIERMLRRSISLTQAVSRMESPVHTFSIHVTSAPHSAMMAAAVGAAISTAE